MRWFTIVLFATLASSAFAQNEIRLAIPEAKLDPKTQEGWKLRLDLGATASWSVNQKFVGVTDGHYLAMGGKVSFFADYLRGEHEWRNTLSLLETFSRTPVINEFLKSADQLSFESLYLWSFGGWWGAFAQFNADTSIFEGNDVRAAPVTYNITDAAGVASSINASKLHLTDNFLPFYLKESIGLFARPIKSEEFNWEIKAGGTARETFANNQRIVTGAAANTVTVATLSNFYQIGPSAGTMIYGELMSKKVSYKAGIDAMYVALRIPTKTYNDIGDRINVETMAALSFKLVDWAALTWDFKGLRIPDISKDFQVQSNLLLTFSYTL